MPRATGYHQRESMEELDCITYNAERRVGEVNREEGLKGWECVSQWGRIKGIWEQEGWEEGQESMEEY